MSETICSETRTARKPHRCAYCNGTVPVGQKYRAWVWVDGGHLYRSRAHERCIELTSLLGWDDDDWAWDWGEFRNYCREELSEHTPFPWEVAP